MTKIATKDPVFSEFLLDTLNPVIPDWGIAQIDATESSEVTYNWGDVLFYTGTVWRQLATADFVADVLQSNASDLPDEAPICIVVGDSTGLGNGYSQTIPAATATTVTVLYRGDARFMKDKLGYADTLTAGEQASTQAQLEKQRIAMAEKLAAVSVREYS